MTEEACDDPSMLYIYGCRQRRGTSAIRLGCKLHPRAGQGRCSWPRRIPATCLGHPSAVLRNALLLAAVRWRVPGLRIVAVRERGGRADVTASQLFDDLHCRLCQPGECLACDIGSLTCSISTYCMVKQNLCLWHPVAVSSRSATITLRAQRSVVLCRRRLVRLARRRCRRRWAGRHGLKGRPGARQVVLLVTP